jgi:MFS family permease
MQKGAPQPDSRTAWVAASAALAILVIAHGAPMIAAVALKPIAVELGTSRAGPSAAGSFTYIGAAVGGISAGWLAGRWGARTIVLFGGVMLAAGLVVSTHGGLSELYWGHGLLMGLFGTSCMLSPLITYVSFWFVRHRGAAVALISSGQSIAGALWPLVFDLLISRAGWRWTMQVYAAFALVAVTLLSALFLRSPPPVAASAAQTHAERRDAKVVGLTPNVAMAALMAAVFCCCVPMNMPMQHIVAFCGDVGISSQHGAAMLSVLLGSAFLARQFWGWMADRLGGLRTLAWSSAAQLVSLAALAVTQDEAALFAIASAFGFGLSGLLPAYVIAVRQHFPAHEAAWRVPTVLFAGYIGMAAGGWLAGAMFDMFGFYLPAFVVGLVFNVVNLMILLWLVARERNDRQKSLVSAGVAAVA